MKKQKIRVGEIVKKDNNPLMIVSSNYEAMVQQLANFNYPSNKVKLIGCLIVSQTEKQYKKYLIRVLQNLETLPVSKLIQDWQEKNLEVNDQDYKSLLIDNEWQLLNNKNIEDHLEEFEKYYPELFKDGLSLTFYSTKKKGMVYLRRLIVKYNKNLKSLNDFQKLILHFITAQLLHSWESSCIHLGMMILENWNIKKMTKWFCQTWPIYKE